MNKRLYATNTITLYIGVRALSIGVNQTGESVVYLRWKGYGVHLILVSYIPRSDWFVISNTICIYILHNL